MGVPLELVSEEQDAQLLPVDLNFSTSASEVRQAAGRHGLIESKVLKQLTELLQRN